MGDTIKGFLKSTKTSDLICLHDYSRSDAGRTTVVHSTSQQKNQINKDGGCGET